jgi:light-independent protochlorophyllide reductase subunit B
MSIATAMKGVHYVLHAPQGDTYADLLFTMIERRTERPPVTYTTFQSRDLGSDTAQLFKASVRDAYERFRPDVLLVGASCTAELIQDDPGGLAATMNLPVPVVPLELPAYQKKENWGAAEALYQLVRSLVPKDGRPRSASDTHGAGGGRPRCNILGPTALGFRHRDDTLEVIDLLEQAGIDINVVAPLGATVQDIARLGDADFNVVLYPEIAGTTAQFLKRHFGQPTVSVIPIGLSATREFITEIGKIVGSDLSDMLKKCNSRLSWYSRSVDSTYLTGKRVFIFGDATHAIAAARVARDELGFNVAGLGTYSREFAREMRSAAQIHGVEALISDDYLEVEREIERLQPELVLGTQMERHIAKRLGIPCAVISAPVHVQDFPARYSPQMGFEGANVLFDTWVHPLMMGLEEHLLGMFRSDFEFGDGESPSHLGVSTKSTADAPARVDISEPREITTAWSSEAESELRKVPFFVRGKARRNTEQYAATKGIAKITIETLYDAKAHYSR